jgi:hypothetical protein
MSGRYQVWRIVRGWRLFARDQRASVAVMMAMVLPLVVGMVTLGVETGLWFAAKRDLQSAADGGALSGAFEVQAKSQSATITSTASRDALRNARNANPVPTIEVNTPPLSGGYVGDIRAVEVIVRQQQTVLFAKMFLQSLGVTARAVGRSGSPGDYCIIALEEAAASAAEFTGNTTIDLGNCGIAANSSNDEALVVSGSAEITALFAEMVGGYKLSGSGKLLVDEIITGSSAIDDPYADLDMGIPGACSGTTKYKNTVTISPQTWCGGISFSANADVTFQPGVYYVKGGEFSVNGTATLRGSGVTIVLTDYGGDWARIHINGGATVELSAPTSGPFSGVLFYLDRNAPDSGSHTFNGGATMELTGVIYIPSQEIKYSGGNASDGGCTRLIGRLVTFTGNADIDNECDGKGVKSNARPPRLVE